MICVFDGLFIMLVIGTLVVFVFVLGFMSLWSLLCVWVVDTLTFVFCVMS